MDDEFPAKEFSTATVALCLALAYVVGVQIGMAFTLEPYAVSLLWPPNSIALAALLLTRTRQWPWLIAAVLPPHMIVQLSGGVPLQMASCWYVSNMAEALLGAWLVRSWLGRAPRFDRVHDATVFLVAGVLLGPAITSFLDASFVAWVGWRYDGDYAATWRMRFFSNSLATITLVPLIVTVCKYDLGTIRDIVRSRGAEAAVLLVLLFVTSVFVFFRPYAIGEGATYVYAPLPLILWAAMRLGVGGVSICIVIVAVLLITGEMQGLGPFSRAGTTSAVLSLQIFLLIAATALVLLAAALSDLQQARISALRRTESLDLALGAARMGVWQWELAEDNFTWRTGSQQTRPKLSRTTLLEFVHPDDRTLLASRLDSMRSGDDMNDVEFRFVRERTVHWVVAKGKHFKKMGLHPHRVIGVWMDVTRNKHREERERSQREQLAHLSRVAILGELSGALTHELSQPLSAILFNAEAGLQQLNHGKPDLSELSAILRDIVADDTRAAEVIRRLRTLFKRGKVQIEPVDVGECIHAVLALERHNLVARNVTATLHLEDRLPTVHADPVQIQQVLLNLISNACDAMAPTADGARDVSITGNADGKGSVLITVRDTGPGIPHPEQVFEPFFTTKTGGIGLGLAISRRIVSAHGGQLWATNNPEGGATFHLSLGTAEPNGASTPMNDSSATAAI